MNPTYTIYAPRGYSSAILLDASHKPVAWAIRTVGGIWSWRPDDGPWHMIPHIGLLAQVYEEYLARKGQEDSRQ